MENMSMSFEGAAPDHSAADSTHNQALAGSSDRTRKHAASFCHDENGGGPIHGFLENDRGGNAALLIE